MPKQEQQTFFNLKITSADGKTDVQEYKSEKQVAELKAEAAKVNSQVEETKAQTFIVTQAESLDEISVLVPNPDVALGYFNYGLTLAQHNVKRDLMRDAEWSPIEGAYDLLADVQEPKEKRVADPLSASRRALKALWSKLHPGAEAPTDEEINAVLASFAGAGVAA
jgi:phage gp29-like protein